MEDNTQDARARERQAMQRAIELLELGQQRGVRSMEAAEALNYLNRLWHLFIDDLARPENDLPERLARRADFDRYLDHRMRSIACGLGKTENFGWLIEICAIIRDGLN